MDDSCAKTEATNSITSKPRYRTSAMLGLFVLQTIMRAGSTTTFTAVFGGSDRFERRPVERTGS